MQNSANFYSLTVRFIYWNLIGINNDAESLIKSIFWVYEKALIKSSSVNVITGHWALEPGFEIGPNREILFQLELEL